MAVWSKNWFMIFSIVATRLADTQKAVKSGKKPLMGRCPQRVKSCLELAPQNI